MTATPPCCWAPPSICAETRNFDGTAVVIFQPAEEGGAGGRAMVEDGMMDRWGIQEVYGMHNMPGMPVGQFAIRPGPLLAATDGIHIEITGKGGHAARPHQCIDPVLVGSPHRAGAAVDRLAQRRSAASRPSSRSACSMPARRSTSSRRRPQLHGTARSLAPEVRDLIERRVVEVAEATAQAAWRHRQGDLRAQAIP